MTHVITSLLILLYQMNICVQLTSTAKEKGGKDNPAPPSAELDEFIQNNIHTSEECKSPVNNTVKENCAIGHSTDPIDPINKRNLIDENEAEQFLSLEQIDETCFFEDGMISSSAVDESQSSTDGSVSEDEDADKTQHTPTEAGHSSIINAPLSANTSPPFRLRKNRPFQANVENALYELFKQHRYPTVINGIYL
jgi:hypothetical protein